MQERKRQDAGFARSYGVRWVAAFVACMAPMGCKEESSPVSANTGPQPVTHAQPTVNPQPIAATPVVSERVYASTRRYGWPTNAELNLSEDGRCMVIIDEQSAVAIDADGGVRWESALLGGTIASIGIGDEYVVAVVYKERATWTYWAVAVWIDRQTGRVVQELPLTPNVADRRRIIFHGGYAWGGAMWVPMDDGNLVRISLDVPGQKHEIMLPSASLTPPVGWPGHGLVAVTEVGLVLVENDGTEARFLAKRPEIRYSDNFIRTPPAIWNDQLALIEGEEIVFVSLLDMRVISRTTIEPIGFLINAPIFSDGFLVFKSSLPVEGYSLNHSGLICIDSQTGEIVWRQRIRNIALENNMALIGGRVVVPEEFVMKNGERATAVTFFDLATGDRFATYVAEELSPRLGRSFICVPPFVLGSNLHLCDRYGNVYRLSDP